MTTFNYSYQWKRGTTAISGATDPSYSLSTTDAGDTITCEVTATNAKGSSSAASASTKTVVAGALFAESFATYDDTNIWWPNLPYFGPGTGAKDPAGASYNAWQGENMNGSVVTPFTIIEDATATNGSALRITCRQTSSAEASYLEGRGLSSTDASWVGGATTSRSNFTFTDSIYFEWRMRLPSGGQGAGMFPALWINDASTDGGGASVNPAIQQGGELDMFEVFGTPEGSDGFLWSTTSWYKTQVGPNREAVNAGRPTTDVAGWHTYGLAWTPTTLRFYQDGIQTGEADAQAAYYEGIKMDIRLNYTVETSPAPDGTTPAELYMDVDYVNVSSSIP